MHPQVAHVVLYETGFSTEYLEPVPKYYLVEAPGDFKFKLLPSIPKVEREEEEEKLFFEALTAKKEKGGNE